jgi:hypothetical protein
VKRRSCLRRVENNLEKDSPREGSFLLIKSFSLVFIELVTSTPDPNTRSLEVVDNWSLGVHLEGWSQVMYNCDTTSDSNRDTRRRVPIGFDGFTPPVRTCVCATPPAARWSTPQERKKRSRSSVQSGAVRVHRDGWNLVVLKVVT